MPADKLRAPIACLLPPPTPTHPPLRRQLPPHRLRLLPPAVLAGRWAAWAGGAGAVVCLGHVTSLVCGAMWRLQAGTSHCRIPRILAPPPSPLRMLATAALTCRPPAGRLVAVGVVDVLPRCLSSVYLFWDPGGWVGGGCGSRHAVQTAGRRAPPLHARLPASGCSSPAARRRPARPASGRLPPNSWRPWPQTWRR